MLFRAVEDQCEAVLVAEVVGDVGVQEALDEAMAYRVVLVGTVEDGFGGHVG
jgi:hypothetical protein